MQKTGIRSFYSIRNSYSKLNRGCLENRVGACDTCTMEGFGMVHDEEEFGTFPYRSSYRLEVGRVIEAMQAGEVRSLQEMAEIAYLSPYHFARTFKVATGVSPGEFVSALRLQRAKEMLLTTDLSASEVCFEVGYKSLGTFSTRFTELVGVAPGRMRRLPEELHAALGYGLGDGITGDLGASPAGGVTFEVHGDVPSGAQIFVGLFPGAVPQRLPAAGAVLTETAGLHRLGMVPDGRYQAMAAALPRSEDPLDSLLPSASLRVGRGDGPVTVRGGCSDGVTSIRMRPMQVLDPPILVALPALLLEDDLAR